MNLVWSISRLKSMSIPEIFFRVRQLLYNIYSKHLLRRKTFKNIPYFGSKKILDQNSIDRVVQNFQFSPHFKIFNQYIDITHIPEWHKDIKSGEIFPKAFCRDVNTRSHPSRSAKYVWEINRMQYLVHIAYAFRKTKKEEYLDLFLNHLDSWISENPFLTGVNWYSNIELNVRLITWFLCWEILDIDSLSQNSKLQSFVRYRWVPLIYAHCKRTVENLSRYSSSNNHLIAEFAGLFIASSFWHFSESRRWNDRAKKGLEKEIIKQHTPEGINREESSGYIQFITDFFLIAYTVAEKTDNSFSTVYKNMLKKIFDYINIMLDMKGHDPKYGDEDDGRAFIPETEPLFNNFISLLASGVIIFGNGRWKLKCPVPDSKNLILFGIEGIEKLEKTNPDPDIQVSKVFRESGHFFLKTGDQSHEIYFHFDAAPLGYLSLAAHGHADALSFVLHIDGQPFLVDPGTYTYHTEKEFRDYFKGTLAHNTIRINEQNQARIAGPTMWHEHYAVKLQEASENNGMIMLKASHNGYHARFGILHNRTINFDKTTKIITIIDDLVSVSSESQYTIEFPIHLHPDVKEVKTGKSQFILSVGENSNTIKLTTDSKLNYGPLRARIDPIIGWYSESFDKKRGCITLYGKEIFSGNQQFITVLEINKNEKHAPFN